MYIILLPIIHYIIGSREMLMQSEKHYPKKLIMQPLFQIFIYCNIFNLIAYCAT